MTEPGLASLKGAADDAAPVYRCMFTTASGSLIPDCEVLLDSGKLRCDLYLPVREIVKLQLRPLQLTKQAKPIDSRPITIRQFEQVVITMVFKDADGQEYPRTAALEVFGNDEQYQAALKNAAAEPVALPAESTADSSALPTSHRTPDVRAAVHPPINQLTPIKHLAGTGKDRVILGKSGAKKLDLKWDADTNSISLLDEEMWLI